MQYESSCSIILLLLHPVNIILAVDVKRCSLLCTHGVFVRMLTAAAYSCFLLLLLSSTQAFTPGACEREGRQGEPG